MGPWPLWILPVFSFFLLLIPLVYLFIRGGEADLQVLGQMVLRPRNLELLRNTFLLTGSVVGLCTLISLPLAWLTERTDLPGRKFLTVLFVLPLTIPGYVIAFALLSLGGNLGVLARVFHVIVPRISGLTGATLALTLYSYPYLYLNLRTGLSNMDPGLEESARSFGYSSWRVFTRVILPQLKPGFLAGWLVIMLYTIGDFGVVALMRYQVFSYAIFTQYSGAFDRVYAAWLSLFLVVLSLGFLFGEGKLVKNLRLARSGAGSQRNVRTYTLGIWAAPAWIFIGIVLFFTLILPFGVLIFWMLQLDQIEPRVFQNFLRSVYGSIPAALVAVTLALPTVYLSHRYPTPVTKFLERAGSVGYGIPPIALALGFVFFSLRGFPGLYQTFWLLILGYSLNFLALAMGPIRTSLLQVSSRVEEAARSLGRTPRQAFFQALLPNLLRGILASGIIVFLMVMKELPITLLLAPTGFNTLATAVFSRTSEAQYAEAAPFAAAIILFSSVFVGLIIRYEGKVHASSGS
jgi:iron(III) transport system permease protein